MNTKIHKKYGGRPLLKESAKRENIIKIALTKKEYNFVLVTAKQAGYKQTARYLRELIFSMIKSGQFKIVQHNLDHFEQYSMLREALYNLNESKLCLQERSIRRKLDPELTMHYIDSIDQLCKELQRVHNKLNTGVEINVSFDDALKGEDYD